MSVATFTPELKKNTDATYTVRIRITRFKKHAYWNIGKRILKSQWNKKPSPKLHNYVIEHPRAKQINNDIKNAMDGLDDIATANPSADAAGIKAAYKKALNPEPDQPEEKPVSFWAFAEAYAEQAKETSYNTGLNYAFNIAEFKKVSGDRTPYPDLFTNEVGKKYLKALKDKGNSPVTISNKLNDLRKIYNAGVKTKALPPLPEKPFEHIKVTVPKKKKARPAADQIKAFFAYQPETPKQQQAKTVAMLQYLLQGARITEALTLEWANVQANYVEYLPQKKAGKPKFVPRSNMLNTLLAQFPQDTRYVLPYIGEDYHALPAKKQHYRKKRVIHEVNEGLKEIGEKLKIPFKLESHMFRHAFADAIIATGSSTHVAAALLGHANTRTTENYIKDLQLEDTSTIAGSIFSQLEDEANRGEL
jgi:site-specific recombinase XerD